MRRRFCGLLRLALLALVALAANTPLAVGNPAAGDTASAAEVMQSVFGNRLRDRGFWRQDNEAFEEGADVPKYWMQVWRKGPGAEVVIVDAYEVKADDTCSALIHVVYSYDPDSGRIHSNAYGANGMSGHGVIELEGTVTTSTVNLRLPGGREVRLRDREDRRETETVVVEAETWNGETWVQGRSATWRRSSTGLPCGGVSPAGSER